MDRLRPLMLPEHQVSDTHTPGEGDCGSCVSSPRHQEPPFMPKMPVWLGSELGQPGSSRREERDKGGTANDHFILFYFYLFIFL